MKIVHPVAAMLRDIITDFISQTSVHIRTSKPAGQDTVAAMVDGLAGACALCVVGGQGSKEEIEAATIATFREALARDLTFMGRTEK